MNRPADWRNHWNPRSTEHRVKPQSYIMLLLTPCLRGPSRKPNTSYLDLDPTGFCVLSTSRRDITMTSEENSVWFKGFKRWFLIWWIKWHKGPVYVLTSPPNLLGLWGCFFVYSGLLTAVNGLCFNNVLNFWCYGVSEVAFVIKFWLNETSLENIFLR